MHGVCVSCLFVCVLVCAKGPNNASPLNKVLIPCLFALPLPFPFLLSFLSFSAQKPMAKVCIFHICAKLGLFIVNISNTDSWKKLVEKLISSLAPVIHWQSWSPEFCTLPDSYKGFPWKVNIYLIRRLLGPELSSFSREEEEEEERDTVSRERNAKTGGGEREREFKVVLWARYNVLWHISDDSLWFYCQIPYEPLLPRLRTGAFSVCESLAVCVFRPWQGNRTLHTHTFLKGEHLWKQWLPRSWA